MLALLFSPSGRIGRARWWLGQIAALAIAIIFVVFFGMLHGVTEQSLSTDDLHLAVGLLILFVLLLWMTFCLTVKRYHDRGKSGWWYLIQFVPLIGGIWALVELGFCSGDDGDNEYGDGPDLNIGEDLKELREMSGQQSPAAATPVYRPAPAPRTGGPAIFGKRG